MLANNETGVIQPVREIVVSLASRHGALVHTDAVQALGKIPVNFGLLGVDLLSVSAHKLGGPAGLRRADCSRRLIALDPMIDGGGRNCAAAPAPRMSPRSPVSPRRCKKKNMRSRCYVTIWKRSLKVQL